MLDVAVRKPEEPGGGVFENRASWAMVESGYCQCIDISSTWHTARISPGGLSGRFDSLCLRYPFVVCRVILHGTVKQIEHEELEDGDKERPSAFSEIMLNNRPICIEELHGAGERTEYQQCKPSQFLIEAHPNPR